MNENRDHRDDGFSEEMTEFSNRSGNSADTEETAEMRDVRRLRWNSERADASLKVFAEYCSERLRSECDELRQGSCNTAIPETLTERLDEMAERFESEKKKEMRRRKTKSLSKVCASILLVFAAAAAAVTIDADALRVKFYEFFSQQEEKGMYISFKEADPDDSPGGDSDDSESRIPIAVELPEELHTILYPADMKEGYRLSEVDIVGDHIMFTFWDEGKETYILFEYMNLDAAMQVDTEYSDNSKTKVNGQEALLQKTESGELVLYWPKDDYLLMLDGGRSLCTKKELVQMAESVQWYDRKVFVQD